MWNSIRNKEPSTKRTVDIQQLSIEKNEVVDNCRTPLNCALNKVMFSISSAKEVRIGYTRAARLMDIMDDKGYVIPMRGQTQEILLILSNTKNIFKFFVT